VSTKLKQILHHTVDREKSLRLRDRLKSPHNSFSLPGRLVRYLHSIVGVPIGNVNDLWHDLPMCGRVAFQFVSHQTTGLTALPFHKLTEESYSGFGVTSFLDEYVDDSPVLVNGAIKKMLFTTNANKNLVHMPGVAMSTISSP
jgi:hypothetical protein